MAVPTSAAVRSFTGGSRACLRSKTWPCCRSNTLWLKVLDRQHEWVADRRHRPCAVRLPPGGVAVGGLGQGEQMAELLGLRAQVGLVRGGGGRLERQALGDVEAVAGHAAVLRRVVR